MGRSGSEGGERKEVLGLVRRGEWAMPEGARARCRGVKRPSHGDVGSASESAERCKASESEGG